MHTSAATPQIFLILKFVQARDFFFVYVSVEESPKKMWGCGCTCMHSGFSKLKVITPPSKVT